ncbi:MAG TPA: TonB-dependent receptor plug domain-containing protein, partial [Hyphomonas sp.]|nr:TonB-dependent receptor plug domain-containing protein [Hyphomonas sp.]
MPFRSLLLGSLAVAALSGPAIAQEAVPASAADRSVFQPADFSQYAPVTALDMVRRVPGFAIQSDDSGQRGFGQARGNVLINGQRVSAKSNGAEAALGRIAAARVVRIEVRDGSQLD